MNHALLLNQLQAEASFKESLSTNPICQRSNCDLRETNSYWRRLCMSKFAYRYQIPDYRKDNQQLDETMTRFFLRIELLETVRTDI